MTGNIRCCDPGVYVNMKLLKAQAALEQAKKELEELRAIPVKVVTAVKNEILDMIREVAKHNNNRMNLPVFKGEFLGKISDRSALQRKDWMESFVHDMGWTTFDEMNADRQTLKQSYQNERQASHVKKRENALE